MNRAKLKLTEDGRIRAVMSSAFPTDCMVIARYPFRAPGHREEVPQSELPARSDTGDTK